MSSPKINCSIHSAICQWIYDGKPSEKSIVEKAYYQIEKHYGVVKDDIVSKCKRWDYAVAKHAFCYVLSKKGYSLSEIAREVGKEHSTINRSISKMGNLMDAYEDQRIIINEILCSL